MFSSLSQNYLL